MTGWIFIYLFILGTMALNLGISGASTHCNGLHWKRNCGTDLAAWNQEACYGSSSRQELFKVLSVWKISMKKKNTKEKKCSIKIDVCTVILIYSSI